MKVKDLIKQGADKVRYSNDLLNDYIIAFKSFFGYEPSCVGCTFSTDWDNFVRHVKTNDLQETEIKTETKMKTKKEKTFELKDNSKIYHYDVKDEKTGQVDRKRSYGWRMSEEFAKNFLTIGTAEEIEERKKYFRVLPKVEKSENRSETTANRSETTDDRAKKRTKKKTD